ncbi:MAG: DUF4386 domain-containing protein [Ignavibacteria bacterium]
MNSNKKTARTAGCWYLALAITSGFGLLFVPSTVIEPGNAEATANNIVASELLYRFGILSTLVGQVSGIFLVLTLYRLFKDVDKKYALLMVSLVVVAVPIVFLNTLNQIAPLLLLNGGEYLKVFEARQLQAQAMLFLDLYDHGISVVQIFWGLWLFPFGYLVFKSGFIPKIFGVLLIIACFGYMADSFNTLLFPDSREIASVFAAAAGSVGEFSIILWLLIKGVKDHQIVAGEG